MEWYGIKVVPFIFRFSYRSEKMQDKKRRKGGKGGLMKAPYTGSVTAAAALTVSAVASAAT